MTKRFLIVAGDPSGDFHAAHLARALKALEPGVRIAAVGGSLLRAAADEFIEDVASLGVTGFLEPLRKLPFFFKLLRRLERWLRAHKPAAVICVDFYGFNRWVLAAAKAQGLPTYYYISPQVWATRSGRVRTLKRLADRMLVIFPFEENLYKDAGVPVSFVGHPLLDHLPTPRPKARSGPLRIGLLPGSRPGEVRRHLPIFLKAVALLRNEFSDIDASVFAAPPLQDDAYRAVRRAGLPLVRDESYRLRSELDFALTSSGTATLENALLGIPMAVVYRLSWPTYWIARQLIRVPRIAMANLLAGRELVPELIQQDATPRRLSEAAGSFLRDAQKLASTREELLRIRRLLGEPGAAARAASIILG
ncbi:MAG: lipid-A-disaccharide synthase [Elusimicrobia bacterium]|nr:lipid-A-disaccharide synthase [Elusimicrobiota bacterium]